MISKEKLEKAVSELTVHKKILEAVNEIYTKSTGKAIETAKEIIKKIKEQPIGHKYVNF